MPGSPHISPTASAAGLRASVTLELSTLALVALLSLLWLVAVRRASSPRVAKRFAVGMFALLGLTGALALTGALRPGPSPPFLLFQGLVLGLSLWVWRAPLGRQLARELPTLALVGFQAFRLPLALVMHRAHTEGLLPARLTDLGPSFHVAAGASAAVLFFVMLERPVPRWVLVLWNGLDLSLLLGGVALSLLPGGPSDRVFVSAPNTVWATRFPFVWLPAFLVPSALLGHLLTFSRLRQPR